MVEVEKINPYGETDSRDKTAQVETMFDSIAPAYDLMNRMMTLGLDRGWRRRAVRTVAESSPAQVLDVATGTGDLALQLCREIPAVRVTGIDLSDGMLQIARRKGATEPRVEFLQGDCLALPFQSGQFDAITVAFGVRNFEHLVDGLRQMHRVLRPGGRLVVLELSSPTNPLVKPFYKLYAHGIIPLVGRIVSRDRRAYSYLPDSIAAVPQGENMCRLMREAGFSHAEFHPLTLGVCTLYIGEK